MTEKVEKKAKKQIKVTQTGSVIGRAGDQRKTMIGLGLRKIRHSKILEDTTSVRGMVKKVKHLVSVETV
jgi:large subunit ribosomal protein L30